MNFNNYTFDVVFKHNDFLVVYKPIGLSFQDDKDQVGFFNRVKKQLDLNLWPVHRLDKVTSGLVILSLSSQSAAEFGKLFENHEIKKCYLAVSDKKPKKKQGRVSGDMKKTRNGCWRLTAIKNSPAITQFQSFSIAPKKRLFTLFPKTGKTHQIRVALKSLGSPILGDNRYGGSDADRAYLHAYALKFTWQGETMTIKSLPREGTDFTRTETFEIIEKFSLFE